MSTATTSEPTAPPSSATSNVQQPIASLPQLTLAKIFPSKTNPRKSFDGPEFDELVESIRMHGILQPVLVRTEEVPHNGNFELVAGERRFRAAKKLGLTTIPAYVRELSNVQVLEMQIVENQHRKDVSPLEEAGGYQRLLVELAKESPKATRSQLVQTIADKIGKSVRYVWGRMKLSELIPALQKDLLEGHIDASHADELVRLCAKDQEEFRDTHLYHGSLWEDSKEHVAAHSVKFIKEVIARQYQLDLAKCGFPTDDAKLVPAAGACSSCLKNTVNNPQADDASRKKATCMDRACFAGKRSAFVAIEALKAKDKASKPELVMVTTQHDLGRAHRNDKGAPKTRKQWKTAHANECEFVQPAVVMDISGLHCQAQTAKLVCANPKCPVHFGAKVAAGKLGSLGGKDAKAAPVVKSKEDLERERREKREEAQDIAVFKFATSKIRTIGAEEAKLMLDRLGSDLPDHAIAAICESFGWAIPTGRDLTYFSEYAAKRVGKLSTSDLAKLLVAVTLGCELADWGSDVSRVDAYVKKNGIDPKVIREKSGKEFDQANPVQPPAVKKDLTPEQLASLADPKKPAVKKSAAKKSTSTVPSSPKAAVSLKSKSTRKAGAKAVKRVAKKSAAKKGGR